MPKLLLHVAAWYQPEEQADKKKWEAMMFQKQKEAMLDMKM